MFLGLQKKKLDARVNTFRDHNVGQDNQERSNNGGASQGTFNDIKNSLEF